MKLFLFCFNRWTRINFRHNLNYLLKKKKSYNKDISHSLTVTVLAIKYMVKPPIFDTYSHLNKNLTQTNILL